MMLSRHFSLAEMTVSRTAARMGMNNTPGPEEMANLRRLAESLEKLGVTVLNEGITGQVHRDRKLLTGDSPLASNALGRLAAEALLKDFGG